MTDYVAPVLTVPQAKALLLAIATRVETITTTLETDVVGRDAPSSLTGQEKRALASDARSLAIAADAIARSLRTLDPEGTP